MRRTDDPKEILEKETLLANNQSEIENETFTAAEQ